MSETRVLGAGTRKIGGAGRGATPAPPDTPAATPEKPRRKRLGPVIALVAVLLAAVAGAVLGPTLLDGADDGAPPAPEPGAIITIEARNINLADGRYLRMGFAIQLAEGAEEITTAQATDAAIALFSGRSMDEVNDPQARTELQDQLRARLVEIYGEEVLAVYYTEFVTQ